MGSQEHDSAVPGQIVRHLPAKMHEQGAQHSQQKAAEIMHLDLDLKSFLPVFAIVNRAEDSDER